MNYTIIVEPEALQDLLDIKSYITRQDSKTKADRFLSQLKDQISSLREMPKQCRKSYYTDEENTHDLIFKGYTIVFKIVDERVHILTIFKQRDY